MEPREMANEPRQIMSDLASDTRQEQKSNGNENQSGARLERQERERLMLREAVWKALCEERGQRYIENRLSNYVVSTPEQQAAVDKLKDYAADFDVRFAAGQSILFLGPVGTGKDHLMFAMARRAIEQFKTLLWLTGADLWMGFRQAMSIKKKYTITKLVEYGSHFNTALEGDESDIIKKLAEVDVLCISDPLPPSGPLTEWQAEKLIHVIDKRYSNMLPTFMTVNVANREEMEQRMGAAAVDRLGHGALAICCNWDSFRKAKA